MMKIQERQRSKIAAQLEAVGATEQVILDAFLSVPRHRFVPRLLERAAYARLPLPIGFGSTISQVGAIAMSLKLADIQPNEVVLDIGCGSGYQAAVVAHLAEFVYGIETVPELVQRSQRTLRALGVSNVQVFTGDGTEGLPQYAPYDVILVAAAARAVPPALQKQLRDGGRLVIPVGSALPQAWRWPWLLFRKKFPFHTLTKVKKSGDQYIKSNHGSVGYVHLKGAFEPQAKDLN